MHHHQIFILIIIFFKISTKSLVEAQEEGFTLDLIHLDSILSPLYNRSSTHSELLRKAVLRSLGRFNYFRSFMHIGRKDIDVSSVMIPSGSDYLTKIYMGTPKIKVFAIADTGSDLIWTKCVRPNNSNIHQDGQLFDPDNSSTYKQIPYHSKICQVLPKRERGNSNECEYNYTYEDGAYTSGILSRETLYLDSNTVLKVPFRSSVFGCSHENRGIQSEVQGVVGLGGGELSLVSQLKAQIEQVFSYCLLPKSSTSSSKLKFGKKAKISGPKVVSTPLISKHPHTFYYLSLEGISVGDNRTRTAQNPGNMIIDSGSTATELHSSLYNEVESMVKGTLNINPVPDPTGAFNLCYEPQLLNGITFPDVIFHFTGASIRLPRKNILCKYNNLKCMMMISSDGDTSVLGNRAQVNFKVEYDLRRRQVSFARADCTKF